MVHLIDGPKALDRGVIPRPGDCGGGFVATFPSVSCKGCGSAFSLRVGSRLLSVSGREVKTGGGVVGATPGIW